MKRNIFSIISILSLFVLFSCTTEKKGTGDISFKLSANLAEKVISLNSARAAEDAIETIDLILILSGDYETTQKKTVSNEIEPEDIFFTVEDIDVGSVVNVKLQVWAENILYYEGSTDVVIVEGDNPVKIKLICLVDDDPEQDINPPAEDTPENTPPEDDNTDEEPEEPAEDTDVTIIIDNTVCQESYTVIYEPNRTDFRNDITVKDNSDKSPNLKAYCFDYATGDIIGVTDSNIYRSKKSEGYNLSSMDSYSYSIGNYGAYGAMTISDIAYVNNIVFLSANSIYKSGLYGLYLDTDTVIYATGSTKNDDLQENYNILEFNCVKSDGKNLYVLTKAERKDNKAVEYIISSYTIESKIEEVESTNPNEQKKVTVTLTAVANNVILSSANDNVLILGKEEYAGSSNLKVSDLMVMGSNVFVLVSDRNYKVNDDSAMISKGALLVLTQNEEGVMTLAGENAIYGWTKNNYTEDLSTALLGPSKFNKLSPTSISFVDEGFTSDDLETEVTCRVVTIDLAEFNKAGELKLFDKLEGSGDYSGKTGYYIDTTAGDEKFTFSGYKLERN